MIHKLPGEIILKISSYLAFQNKLNLAKTCSILYNLISSAILYQQLNLYDGIKDPEEIIKKFERNDFDGSQVKELTLCMPDISETLRSQLSIVFPNVNCVHMGWRDENILRDWNRTQDLTPPLSRWINTIQTYDIYMDWPEIMYTLKFNVFPHLTKLRLSHLYSDYERREGFDPHYFIPIIKNAPSLTKLSLQDCDINLVFLEEVHNSCPLLQTLILENVVMVIDTPALPEDIKPADGVLNLEIYDTANLDRNGLLFEYIIKKYTSLVFLIFDLNRREDQVNVKLELYFGDFFHNLDRDDEGADNREPNNIVTRLREDFYLGNLVLSSSGANFFSRLPKTITTLKMDVISLNGLIEIINEANMNIAELDFCDTSYYEHFLKDANQLRHFEKMASLKTLRIPISSTVQEYRNFIISSSITHLELLCPDGPVFIYWVLKMFPCLQHVCIKDSACELDRSANDSNDNLWVHPTLNSLRLDRCTINSRVANYMKALAIILESQGRAFDIDLSGCYLEKFSMSLSSGKASKEDESYRPFKIQNATKQMIHANWGETISLEQTNNDSGILEYKTSNKGLWI